MVIQNSYGEVMSSLSERIPIPSSVTVPELPVARRAVFFAKEIGINHSIFQVISKLSSILFVRVSCYLFLWQANMAHKTVAHISLKY